MCEDSLFVYKSILSADRIYFIDHALIKYKTDDSESASANAKFFVKDICYAIDGLAHFLTAINQYAAFEHSFRLWADRKCSWVYGMLNGSYCEYIEDIMKKYNLNVKK